MVVRGENGVGFGEEVESLKGNLGLMQRPFGSGHPEARLKDFKDEPGRWGAGQHGPIHCVYEAVASWVVYHFHDTSLSAGVRRQKPTNDNEVLRPHAEKL